MDKIETVMYSVDSTGTTLPVVFYNDNILNSNDRPEESKHIYLLHIIHYLSWVKRSKFIKIKKWEKLFCFRKATWTLLFERLVGKKFNLKNIMFKLITFLYYVRA